MVGINSLQFYSTDDMFLRDHLARLVEPGGQIGAIIPGFIAEFAGGVPDSVAPDWGPALYNWHSAAWWRWHWEKTGPVRVETADNLENGDGFGLFKEREEVMGDSELCRRDEGRHVTFVRLAARKIR